MRAPAGTRLKTWRMFWRKPPAALRSRTITRKASRAHRQRSSRVSGETRRDQA
jgi:hypothetical protein